MSNCSRFSILVWNNFIKEIWSLVLSFPFIWTKKNRKESTMMKSTTRQEKWVCNSNTSKSCIENRRIKRRVTAFEWLLTKGLWIREKSTQNQWEIAVTKQDRWSKKEKEHNRLMIERSWVSEGLPVSVFGSDSKQKKSLSQGISLRIKCKDSSWSLPWKMSCFSLNWSHLLGSSHHHHHQGYHLHSSFWVYMIFYSPLHPHLNICHSFSIFRVKSTTFPGTEWTFLLQTNVNHFHSWVSECMCVIFLCDFSVKGHFESDFLCRQYKERNGEVNIIFVKKNGNDTQRDKV